MNWKVFEAVATGTSHIERMTVCQDACRTWVGGDGFFVAVVSDGAGSASLSEIGSRICSDVIVEQIASCLEEDLGVFPWRLKALDRVSMKPHPKRE